MNKAILVAQFLRDRAWWRLDSAGASAPRVARSVVSLLDAAGYLRDLPDPLQPGHARDQRPPPGPVLETTPQPACG